jgi:hypothetical protein
MNIEDLEATSALQVLQYLEERAAALGGQITGTEVIGMIPDGLVLPAAEDRLRLLDSSASRLLSARLAEHVSARLSRELQALLAAIEGVGEEAPAAIREAAERLSVGATPVPG